MAKIIIKRKNMLFRSAHKFDVFLGNKYIGELRNGGLLEIPADTGAYTLLFKDKSDLEGTSDVSFEVTVIAPLETVEIVSGYDKNGLFTVNYACDTACKPVSQKKKAQSSGLLPIVFAAGFLVCGVLCTVIIKIAFTPTKSAQSDSSNSVSADAFSELTDEEKAKIELEQASLKFSSGQYRGGLAICQNITMLYPDTETAANMSTYIQEQYEQYTHITAKQLMTDYEENLVNADNEYADKVLIVSGVVSKVDKTNKDTTLCVLLQSGNFLGSVQLNFDTSQTNAVSALKKGSSVQVIGKCTGKSGKQLLIFDGNNVMLTDCVII